MIWLTETVCPGKPRMVYEAWSDPYHRLKWDIFLSDTKKIVLDASFPNLCIMKSASKPAAGGIISARDFVDLLRIYEVADDMNADCKSIQIVGTSIERDDMPQNKGFVRGTVVLCGLLFEKIEESELDKYKLPRLMVLNGECAWTRIRYINQADIKGWIPASVINSAMTSTQVGLMKDLRDYVIKKRLGLN